jgi:hypothetical protein
MQIDTKEAQYYFGLHGLQMDLHDNMKLLRHMFRLDFSWTYMPLVMKPINKVDF